MYNENIIKYHIGFIMNIIGCNLSFSIEDSELLKLISKDDVKINDLEFSKCEDNSILSGSIYVTNPGIGYDFILFELKDLIIKALVIIPGIEDLRIKDNVQFSILNEKEILDANYPIITCPSKFMVIEPKTPSVSKADFEDSLRTICASNDKFNNTTFWQYISYSVTDVEKGKTKFDIISQYRLLWTSFNSLYSMLCPGKTERKSLEEYTNKNYVVEYFKKAMNDHLTYKYFERLIKGDLTLRYGKENISDKLRDSIEEKNYKEISKNIILCLKIA